MQLGLSYVGVNYSLISEVSNNGGKYRRSSVGQLRGGVNQLLPCLINYASFKLFVETLDDDHNNAGK